MAQRGGGKKSTGRRRRRSANSVADAAAADLANETRLSSLCANMWATGYAPARGRAALRRDIFPTPSPFFQQSGANVLSGGPRVKRDSVKLVSPPLSRSFSSLLAHERTDSAATNERPADFVAVNEAAGPESARAAISTESPATPNHRSQSTSPSLRFHDSRSL